MERHEEYPFTCEELATACLQARGIHEGLWSLFVEFGLATAYLGLEGSEAPTAVVPLQRIGIERCQAPGATTVDAAVVNPRATRRARGTRKQGA